METYKYSAYPKFLFHETKEPIVVASEVEHKALGKDWFEEPVKKSESKAKKDESGSDKNKTEEPKIKKSESKAKKDESGVSE